MFFRRKIATRNTSFAAPLLKPFLSFLKCSAFVTHDSSCEFYFYFEPNKRWKILFFSMKSVTSHGAYPGNTFMTFLYRELTADAKTAHLKVVNIFRSTTYIHLSQAYTCSYSVSNASKRSSPHALLGKRILRCEDSLILITFMVLLRSPIGS